VAKGIAAAQKINGFVAGRAVQPGGGFSGTPLTARYAAPCSSVSWTRSALFRGVATQQARQNSDHLSRLMPESDLLFDDFKRVRHRLLLIEDTCTERVA
jgi:hypothetical protein